MGERRDAFAANDVAAGSAGRRAPVQLAGGHSARLRRVALSFRQAAVGSGRRASRRRRQREGGLFGSRRVGQTTRSADFRHNRRRLASRALETTHGRAESVPRHHSALPSGRRHRFRFRFRFGLHHRYRLHFSLKLRFRLRRGIEHKPAADSDTDTRRDLFGV